MLNYSPKIIAVSLNPSIDRGIEVPNLTLGAHQPGRQLFRRPAGKAVNLARALGILQTPALLIGWIGKGQQDDFKHYLTNEYVSCQLFPVAGRTRENITLVDPVSRTETHIRDRGFEVTAADLDPVRKALASACGKGTCVVFTGSLPPGMSPDDLIALVRICGKNGANVCLDSAGTVLRACRPLGIWLMKPNAAELSEMLGTCLDTPDQIAAAGRELAKDVAITIVTMGKDGALLFSAADYLRGKVHLDPRQVKNTVGCGDALLAGFLAGAAAGKAVRESFALALAAATAAAVSITPGDLSLADAERFVSQVEDGPIN